MTRLNVLLLLVLLGSCVFLVRVSYESRQLFAELDKAQTEEQRLATELQKLNADKQSQATPLRVEKVARERLAMRNASPAITQYVGEARPASAAASGATP